jgi:hypothetical protein
LVIGFIDHSQVIITTKYNPLADSHTTNHSTLNLLSDLSLVFTIRFLAMDLSQSHGNFKHRCNYSSHTKSSWHSLNSFDCRLPEFLSTALWPAWVSGYIASGRTTAQKTRPLPSNGRTLLLRIRWNVFTESLLSNGHDADPHRNTSCNTCSIVACVYCGHCLAMGLLYCWLRTCCGLVTESLPRNGYLCHSILGSVYGSHGY